MNEKTSRLPLKGLDRLTKRDVKHLQQRAAEATEELRGKARQQEREIEARQERIAESERYQRAHSEHARTLDARDRVAAQVARSTGMSHSEAQSFVAQHMERSRNAR